MNEKNALARKKLKPESYQIPQTVTSAVERREIRKFIGMRETQIKDRLDRIYKFKKEQYVEGKYQKKVDAIIKDTKLAKMVKRYNKDNEKIRSLLNEKEAIMEQVENLCDEKQRVSDKLRTYANSEDDLKYNSICYGNIIVRHSEKTISSEELLQESQIKDQIKADFDTNNSKPMENRNRKLKYLKEKIEERLLFGKRNEIQKLFCNLEQMNASIEKELIKLGIDNFSQLNEEGEQSPSY